MAISDLISGGKTIGRSARRLVRDYRSTFQGLAAQPRLRREIDAALAGSSAGPLPDFVIIGAPKCATSWLAWALRRQPRVFVVPDEIEYFSSHLDQPLDWYLSHFESLLQEAKGSLADGRPILGEKSAGYCGLSRGRIRLMRRLLPDVRLVLMIRDPVKRHWSHAKRVFSKQKAQRRGYNSIESRQQLYGFFCRTRRFSEFSRMIENWTDVYPADQLLVVSQEVAFTNPVATLERVVSHLGCSIDLNPSHMKRALRNDRNQGPAVPMPPDVSEYLERMFAGERARLDSVLRARLLPQAVSEIGLPQARP